MSEAEWPSGVLYYSPRGLFPCQADAIAECLTNPASLVVFDTGLGKSHIGMATGAYAIQFGEADVVLFVCKQNKVGEWMADLAEFTKLTVRKNYGSVALRKRWFEKNEMPQAVVTTFDTGRLDLTAKVPSPSGKTKVLGDGWLLPYLLGKRVVIVHDEVMKLGNRNSSNGKAWDYVLKRLRKTGSVRLVQMTATTGNPENTYNMLQAAYPERAPLVKDFEKTMVRSYDQYGTPRFNTGLIPWFHQTYLANGYMIRKRKTDPDVIAQFPRVFEDTCAVELPEDQAEFYDLVRSLGCDPDTGEPLEEMPPGLWTLLRQVAGHPQAILHSKSKLAAMLVEEFGLGYIQALHSGKTERLVDRMETICLGQEAKAIVFTRYAGSVLIPVKAALEKAKIEVHAYSSYMTPQAREESMVTFKKTDTPCVFLCGDGASDGVNLPMASYVDQYEPTPSHDLSTQRINRAVRIGDTGQPPVTATIMRALYTCDESALEAMLAANKVGDMLRGDDEGAEEGWVTPAMRRAMLLTTPIAKKRKQAA